MHRNVLFRVSNSLNDARRVSYALNRVQQHMAFDTIKIEYTSIR